MGLFLSSPLSLSSFQVKGGLKVCKDYVQKKTKRPKKESLANATRLLIMIRITNRIPSQTKLHFYMLRTRQRLYGKSAVIYVVKLMERLWIFTQVSSLLLLRRSAQKGTLSTTSYTKKNTLASSMYVYRHIHRLYRIIRTK